LFGDYILEREGLIMGRFCKNCGSPLKPDVKFCVSCGTKTSESEASQKKVPGAIAKETVFEMKKTEFH
jgi:uncharacterized OB-fold protein